MSKILDQREDKPLQYSGGEVIITRPAVADQTLHSFNGEQLTNRQILSKINESGGGLSFEEGGEIPEEIHTTGSTYEYGGMQVKDSDIVRSCGCKHKAKSSEARNSDMFSKYASGALMPKESFQQFRERHGNIYRRGGKLFLPYQDGQGFYSLYAETKDPKGAISEIYGMVSSGEPLQGDYTHYADIFDVKGAYDKIECGSIPYQLKDIPTELSDNRHGRFNSDYAENMDDVDFTKPQGLVVEIPAGLGLPEGKALIDGRHRSHLGQSNGINEMQVYHVSDPEVVKELILPLPKNSFATGGHVEGELSYSSFMRRFGKFIRQDAYKDEKELVAVLPTSYGHKYFSVPMSDYKGATKKLYNEYLREKDRYSNGGELETYRYALTIRPFGIGTYPDKGFVRYEPSLIYPFGILHYKAEIDPSEVQHFDLIPVDILENLNGKKIKWFEDYEGTIKLIKDPVGKIMGVGVDVMIEDGEIVPEKLGVNRFLQNYYKGKWGTAYNSGGNL